MPNRLTLCQGARMSRDAVDCQSRTDYVSGMGMFQVHVKVENPADASRSFEEDFWVDSGALYSFAPEERLTAIGLTAAAQRDLVLADGRKQRLRLGEARMTIGGVGETLTCPVVFGPPGSLHLLGATALETFGVAADPVERKLKPIAALIGGYTASRPPA